MPMLMIVCPVTGKPVPTGIAMDAQAFAALHRYYGVRHFACPRCGCP